MREGGGDSGDCEAAGHAPTCLSSIGAHAGPAAACLPLCPARCRDSIDREAAEREELDPEEWEGQGEDDVAGGTAGRSEAEDSE